MMGSAFPIHTPTARAITADPGRVVDRIVHAKEIFIKHLVSTGNVALQSVTGKESVEKGPTTVAEVLAINATMDTRATMETV